jgi:hypothetical protein
MTFNREELNMDEQPIFRDRYEAAEAATRLVGEYLDGDLPEVASVLHPAARALWDAVVDGLDDAAAMRACQTALSGLRFYCRADIARHFLCDVCAYLDQRPDRGAPPRLAHL